MEDPIAPSMEMVDPTPTPSYTYTDPISSFFNGIFFIIIMVLVLIFIILIFVGRAFGLVSDAPASPPPEVKKEAFKDGPPYPRCQTDGALAMF
jgi:hypothetical protein